MPSYVMVFQHVYLLARSAGKEISGVNPFSIKVYTSKETSCMYISRNEIYYSKETSSMYSTLPLRMWVF